jgi:hypothetical protein
MKLINNKKILLWMFFIVGIFIFSSVVSAYVQSSTYSPYYLNSMGQLEFGSGQSLQLDESMCAQGTDFLVQISPLGCENSPVRSDLLAEQNVNVFCKMAGLQINPLIKVSEIDSIRFDKQYPKEVLNIGYMPAQAALGYTPENLDGSLILNNF